MKKAYTIIASIQVECADFIHKLPHVKVYLFESFVAVCLAGNNISAFSEDAINITRVAKSVKCIHSGVFHFTTNKQADAKRCRETVGENGATVYLGNYGTFRCQSCMTRAT